MNWFRQNPFLSAYILVVIIGVGVLAFFVNTQRSELTDLNDQFTAKVEQLRSLQNRQPFPNQENLEATRSSLESYASEIGNLRERLLQHEVAIPEVTPAAFQDNLRQVVSDVEKRAAAAGTKLPEGFYMGFNLYRDILPSTPHLAGLLSRQLETISLIVNRLLELKVEEIVSLTRQNLPQEDAIKIDETKLPILSKSPFAITFRSDQNKARSALNSIESTKKAFFIIRSIDIQNSEPNSPLRSAEDAMAGTTPSTPANDEATDPARHDIASIASPNQLKIIVGRESVTVGLQLEMVTFNIPEVKL